MVDTNVFEVNPNMMIFQCACADPWHVLQVYIDTDPDGEINALYLQVTYYPSEASLWERIKGAWKVLRGGDHILSEIHLEDSKFIGYMLTGFLHFVGGIDRNKIKK